jgi:hypothetical protein
VAQPLERVRRQGAVDRVEREPVPVAKRVDAGSA